MAFTFTPDEPIKYCEFSYTNFLDYILINSNIASLPFTYEWKQFWCSKLKEEDDAVKEYIQQHSNSNPLWDGAILKPEQFKGRNEMFQYVYRSNHGEEFYFHFDIEKVNQFSKMNLFPKLTLNKTNFFIDPDTEFGEGNLNDTRLPFFTPMFTLDRPYILIDGNKRVMAKIDKGIENFEGYEVGPNIIIESFFTGLEVWFYTLLYEVTLIQVLLLEGKTSDEIKRSSNAFRR